MALAQSSEPDISTPDIRLILGWVQTASGHWLTVGRVRSPDANPTEGDMADWLVRHTHFDGIVIRGGRYVLVTSVDGTVVRLDGTNPSGYVLADVLATTVVLAHRMLLR